MSKLDQARALTAAASMGCLAERWYSGTSGGEMGPVLGIFLVMLIGLNLASAYYQFRGLKKSEEAIKNG
ncbi:hypothetical protein [Sphingobium nicotianae]|uniref:Holin n=1 Tax=Sphingobium nicotianae TaxID=2782607 RepID=A0A9X1AI06_9SPHN|nr:hypothetical protein [Sphingobium nicotianae]MBT2185486.1 hypothetical protein [Sphingobium nicotianae]